MTNLFTNETHQLVKGVSAYRQDRGTNPRSTKLATFTATFAIGVSIKNIVLHGNQNKNWITWPSAEYLKGGYSTGFLPIFEFDDGVKQRLDDELFDALRALNVDIKHEG